MARRCERWKRLVRHLRPGDYARRFPRAAALLHQVASGEAEAGFTSCLEEALARRYEFPIRLALMTAQDYLAELRNLPDWWHGEVARRDALFYTRGLDRGHVRERIEAMELGDEAVYFGEHAVFWGKFDEKNFLKTAYHRRLLREDFYRQVIRSGSTVEKIASMLARD